jgi:hypothetical protein
MECEYADRESGAKRDCTNFQECSAMPRTAVLTCSCFGLSLDREGVLETLTHLNRLTGAGVGCRSFTGPDFDSCGIFKDAVTSILAVIAAAGKNPPQRTRTSRPGPRPQSVKEARPGKRDRRCVKNCLFALTGPLIARNRGGNRNQRKNKRTAQRTVSSLSPKTYEFR